MSNDANRVSSVCPPKLEKPEEFIQRRRRINALIRQDDPTLITVSEKTVGVNKEKMSDWEKNSAKEKCNLVLFIGDSVLEKTR